MPSPTTPHKRTHVVWAVPRSLATTEGIFSFPLGTKMFQFPRFPSPGLCVQPRDAVGSPTAGFPIRISSDLHLYTTSRGFSQCPTSFFGTWRLGIHRKLLVAFLRDAEKSKLFALIFVFYSIGKVLLPLGSLVVDHLPVCPIFFIRHTRRLSTPPLHTATRQIRRASLPSYSPSYSFPMVLLLPNFFLFLSKVEMRGFEPLASAVQGRRSPI